MKQFELPNREYRLLTDSQEIGDVCAYLGITEYASEITGVLIPALACYDTSTDVFLTDASKPYALNCEWYDIEYFSDSVPDELELQDVRDDREFDDDYGA